MTVYTLTKFLHVLFAITAVGFNASYAIWIARAARDPEHQLFALKGIKFMDDRFANPGYGLLLISGLTMVFVSKLSLTRLWLGASLVLWLVVAITGFALYTPTLRAQIRLLEAGGAGSAEFAALSRRGSIVGIALAVIVVVIAFFMVTKPTF